MLKPPKEIERLPKWAQGYIAGLQREIELQAGSIDSLSNEHPKSNVVVRGKRLQDPDIGLPPNSQVFFYAGEPRESLTNMIEVRHDGNDSSQIKISSYGGRLRLLMHSSNSFSVELDKRLWA